MTISAISVSKREVNYMLKLLILSVFFIACRNNPSLIEGEKKVGSLSENSELKVESTQPVEKPEVIFVLNKDEQRVLAVELDSKRISDYVELYSQPNAPLYKKYENLNDASTWVKKAARVQEIENLEKRILELVNGGSLLDLGLEENSRGELSVAYYLLKGEGRGYEVLTKRKCLHEGLYNCEKDIYNFVINTASKPSQDCFTDCDQDIKALEKIDTRSALKKELITKELESTILSKSEQLLQDKISEISMSDMGKGEITCIELELVEKTSYFQKKLELSLFSLEINNKELDINSVSGMKAKEAAELLSDYILE